MEKKMETTGGAGMTLKMDRASSDFREAFGDPECSEIAMLGKVGVVVTSPQPFIMSILNIRCLHTIKM